MYAILHLPGDLTQMNPSETWHRSAKTYSDFQELLGELGITLYDLQTEVAVGGASGGDCWGSESHSWYADATPPDIQVDAILEVVYPNMTILQYHKLQALTTIRSRTSGGDYYGNYTKYAVRHLNILDLYHFLQLYWSC